MENQPQFNAGANALTNTLRGMIKGISEQPPQLDTGKINSDYSLTTRTFPRPIPKNEYSVCRHLLYDPSVPLTQTYVDGSHDHYGQVPAETHQHNVRLPSKMRRLKPGDKVLVAILGNEFVVIDIIYDAKYLGSGEPRWS